MKRVLLVLAAVLCMGASIDPAERLPDPAQEARARTLFREVRCLVCQNESIDDSEADLARDLRQIVREQVVAGKSDREIKAYLVDRYGEFVLFKPPFSPGNAVLWLTPVALVGIGGLVWVFLLRRKEQAGSVELSPEEEARLAALGDEQSGRSV
jgi:cytochrome c-type biogenesis protein CcmH